MDYVLDIKNANLESNKLHLIYSYRSHIHGTVDLKSYYGFENYDLFDETLRMSSCCIFMQ